MPVDDDYADDDYVDGNALAGELQELFAVDVTIAVGECAHCGRQAPMAETRVYTRAPGTVVRCRGCGGALLKLVTAPHARWLDLSGLARLTIRAPEAAAG
ncbi:DUF6510 family protein [Angustibacter sp. McL0619]|uniref:DUF6510 family protein n=1 Tax=Angustibacter sp. McL0619 TaxID=3415676 RepID=UPI003CED5DC4